MTLTLDRVPTRTPRPLRTDRAVLVVRRQDISWRNVTPGVVLITVRVRNAGSERSEPTTLTLESAPFGAFVRWTPLDTRAPEPVARGGRTRGRRGCPLAEAAARYAGA